MKKAFGTERGFTLLELVIAVTLLSAMIAILSGGFNLSIRAWEAGERRLENHWSVTEAVNLINQQLKTAKKVYVYDPSSNERRMAFSGDARSLVFVTSNSRLRPHDKSGGLFFQKITFIPEDKALYFEEVIYDRWRFMEETKGEKFKISEGRINTFRFEYYLPENFFDTASGGEKFRWFGSINLQKGGFPSEGAPWKTLQLFPEAVRLHIETDDREGEFVWPVQYIPLFQDMEIRKRESRR